MKKTQLLSILVTVFGFVFAFEAVTMQFVYSSMDVYATPLSMYATGSLWYVVSSGLMMIATSYLILGYLFLHSSDSVTLRLRIGSVTLIGVGVCTYVLTVFQTDIGATVSLRGHIHVIAAHLHFALLPIATVFISIGLNNRQWRTYRVFTLAFSGVLEVGVLLLLFKDNLGLTAYSGLTQKIVILTIVGWIVVTAQTHLHCEPAR
jgi:hypothetical protein